MIGYAARRFASALLTAWVASMVAFVLFWTVPNVDPSYFLGGAYRWRVFPAEGYVGLRDSPWGWARHLTLPWIASALPFAGAYVHVVRASLLDAVDEDWVRTARAKGLSEKQVIRRHVLRNGLIPPVNIWGLDFSHACGGFALYVEVIFGLPGVGLLTPTLSAASTCRRSSRSPST